MLVQLTSDKAERGTVGAVSETLSTHKVPLVAITILMRVPLGAFESGLAPEITMS